MEQINKFIHGVKKFKDFSLYKNTEWTFPSLNLRIVNSDDAGYLIMPLNSNEVLFQSSTNHHVLGSIPYKGKLFIITKNNYSDSVEVGVYPSPKNWNEYPQPFEKQYKLLHNLLKNGTVVDFQTEKLNLDFSHELEIIAKEIHDHSINLYVADYKNTTFVINTGFNIDEGNLTGEVVDENSFTSSNALIINSDTAPKITYKGLSVGGNNKPGTYEIFVRYVSSSFDRTNFFKSIYPIIVSNITNRKNPEGVTEKDINKIQQYVASSINLEVDITSLNNNFKYIEIGILRKSSDEFGVPIRETYLISKLYPIHLFQTNNIISISGKEIVATLSEEELLYSFVPANIDKTHTIVKSRYFGGNWKGFSYDAEALKAYAEAIKTDFTFDNPISDTNLYGTGNEFDNEQHRRNSLSEGTVTYTNTSYFRGEIVPFGVVFIIEGGFETPAFPVDGIDAHTISNKFQESSKFFDGLKGLVRFPTINTINNSNIGDSRIGDIRYPLGVKFDNTNAISLLNNPNYDYGNIVGFYYVRGERIKNLLYQGIAVPMVYKYSENTGGAWGYRDTNCKIPFLEDYNNTDKAYFPSTLFKYNSSGDLDEALREGWNVQMSSMEYGIFSPDFMFDEVRRVNEGANVFVKTLYTPNEITNIVGVTAQSPKIKDFVYSNAPTDKLEQGSISFINQGVFIKGGYSSYVRGGNKISNHLFHDHYNDNGEFDRDNRPFVTPNYIAVKFQTGTNASYYRKAIVNVYKDENNFDSTATTGFYKESREIFIVENTYYWPISERISLSENTALNKYFKGDAFIQRVTFRSGFVFGSDDIYTHDTDKSTNHYGYGMASSILVESEVNAAMRNNVEAWDPDNQNERIIFSYYPSILGKGKSLFTWLMSHDDKACLYEAFQINDGYNKLESLQKRIGYDVNRNVDILKYLTRIFFSAKSGVNELRDNFRNISPISFQDLPLNKGQIIKLMSFNDTLFSIQENAINRHYIGQKKMQTENMSSDVVLKETGIYLSEEHKTLAEYGSQHQKSVVFTESGIYGVDFKNGFKIWHLGTSQSRENTNKVSFGVTDLTIKGEIRGWIDEFVKENNLDKILINLPDNPIQGIGITTGYNKKYKELYFTFHLKEKNIEIVYPNTFCISGNKEAYEVFYVPKIGLVYFKTAGYYDCNSLTHYDIYVITEDLFIPFVSGMNTIGGNVYYTSDDNTSTKTAYLAFDSRINVTNLEELNYKDGLRFNNMIKYKEIQGISKTLIYSELLQVFICEYSATPGHYTSIGENLVSIPTIKENPFSKIYIHDKDDDYLTFFDKQEQMQLSIIVNGGEKAMMLIKSFEAYMITSNDEELVKLEFYTDTMQGSVDPFIPNVWSKQYLKPEYKENRWLGPIPYNDIKEKFNIDDHLRGEWLKMVITFDKNKYFYIREIITSFTQSFI